MNKTLGLFEFKPDPTIDSAVTRPRASGTSMYNVFVTSVFYTGSFSVNEWSIRYGIVFAVHFF